MRSLFALLAAALLMSISILCGAAPDESEKVKIHSIAEIFKALDKPTTNTTPARQAKPMPSAATPTPQDTNLIIPTPIAPISPARPTTAAMAPASAIHPSLDTATSSSLPAMTLDDSPPPLPPRGSQAKPSAPLDLNQATAEQLQALPGVGPDRARLIIAHRKAIGAFQRVDQLKEVFGISDTLYKKIAPGLAVKTTPLSPAAAPALPPGL